MLVFFALISFVFWIKPSIALCTFAYPGPRGAKISPSPENKRENNASSTPTHGGSSITGDVYPAGAVLLSLGRGMSVVLPDMVKLYVVDVPLVPKLEFFFAVLLS